MLRIYVPRFSQIRWSNGKSGWRLDMATWDLIHLEDNFLILPRFSRICWKKWKIGVKIAYGKFGYYPLVAWMLRIYLAFLKFTDQMENRGKAGIWELRVLAACGPNSQKSSHFSRIQWKKIWIWHPRICSTWRTNSRNLLRFSRIHWEHKLFFKICNFFYLSFLTKTN